ncbi:MAG: hypothetical protein Q9191_003302 [Dirinaria sp. TL-2023a]
MIDVTSDDSNSSLASSKAQSQETLQSDEADDVETTEGGWICRVQRLEKRLDSHGRTRYHRLREKTRLPHLNEDIPSPLNQQSSEEDGEQQSRRLSIISYVYDITDSYKGRVETEIYIEIRSPLILGVLRENAKFYQESLSGRKVRFMEPYQLLWHQYHALKTYLKDMSNPKDSRTHIKVLTDFLESCGMPNVSELLTLCDPTKVVRSISFASLWFLYTPGTLIVNQRSPFAEWDVLSINTVVPATKRINRKGRSVYSDQTLDCVDVEYDGKVFHIVNQSKDIVYFDGLRPVAELEYVPFNMLEDAEKKRKVLINRGRKFWDLRGLHMKEFVDSSLSDPSLAENERLMVDWATYGNLQDERVTSRLRDRDFESDIEGRTYPMNLAALSLDITQLNIQDGNPSDSILILCPSLVWGFSFQSKQWRQYHVDCLVDVDFQKKSFDRLVLKEDYKAILKAMVAQHFTQGKNRFQDLVAGKGQGLNILLHGPPGVGKTLAAECIADLYERPLYSITSGDLGTDPETMERNLRQVFDYAVAWDAVLLLDEADVFLAERNLENFRRNALVSDPLSVDDRRQIWYHFIKDLKHLSKDHRRDLARHARDEWCHQDFNGRQVRNTVKTALTLARQDGVEVQARHFQTVLDIGTKFAGYMQRLKKMDRERLAEAIGTRLDLTANTLKSPEIAIASHAPKRRSADDGLESSNRKEPDLDWD